MSFKNIVEHLIPRINIFYRIFALLVAVALILLMFPIEKQGEQFDYSVGGFWNDNDLYAPFDFNVTQVQEELDKALEEVRSKSLLYYVEDSSAYYAALRNLDRMAHNGLVDSELKRQLRHSIDSIYEKGYIETPSYIVDLPHHTIVILKGNFGSEHQASEFISRYDLDNSMLTDSILVPNICFDATRSQLEEQSLLSQTSYHSDMVQTGELVIAKGELVTEEKAAVLQSLQAENNHRFSAQYSITGHLVGQALLCIFAFMALYMFLLNTKHSILDDNRKITIVLCTILLMSGVTALVVRTNPQYVLAVPLCIVPILMHIFFDMRAALYIHLTTVIILANLVPNSFEFIYYQLITGIMSIISVKSFEHRSKFFIVGLIIFVTYSLIYTAGLLSQDTNLHNINYERYVMFFFNALLTLLAFPLIYLAEVFFGFTSSLTLLEISNTNTPVLRELSRKAPGTFQHSMQVANISEDLINEIGGNALLAKVGALYHDIGKIANPSFFTENQTSGFNPHDELNYDESARIITQHVTQGIELARKYHLPSEIIDFIRTHHGTSYTGYFYAKQKERFMGEDIDDTPFRYPGPMPYTREMAVVMLVDSTEAACKSLKDHSEENLNNFVDRIITGKIDSGQLSNCDLTFADITKIRKILKSRMISIYQARIAYPVVENKN